MITVEQAVQDIEAEVIENDVEASDSRNQELLKQLKEAKINFLKREQSLPFLFRIFFTTRFRFLVYSDVLSVQFFQ